MRRLFLTSVALVWAAGMVQAEILVASRVIPANTIIKADDVRFESSDGTGAVVDPAKIIGMEARKALFAGRPISIADVGTPAIVQRNQVIQLVFRSNGLLIRTDGRTLDRAAPGETVRVMNLGSRSIVHAIIDDGGVGYVSQ